MTYSKKKERRPRGLLSGNLVCARHKPLNVSYQGGSGSNALSNGYSTRSYQSVSSVGWCGSLGEFNTTFHFAPFFIRTLRLTWILDCFRIHRCPKVGRGSLMKNKKGLIRKRKDSRLRTCSCRRRNSRSRLCPLLIRSKIASVIYLNFRIALRLSPIIIRWQVMASQYRILAVDKEALAEEKKAFAARHASGVIGIYFALAHYCFSFKLPYR